MYLDLALFLLVALTAIRGLLNGFIIPLVKLGGMLSALFLAAPLRDLVIADVQPYFERAIQPEVFSRMLWWTCAFLIYVILAGVAATIVKLVDRQISKDFPGRGLSRALGLMWGATKGGLIAAVIAFVLVKYEASPWIAIIPSLKEQMVESSAVSMTREHQPVPLIWTWTPVAALRDHIYDKGWMPAASEALKDATIPVKTDEAVEAASAVREPETQVAKADATRTETSVPPARATRAATPPKALTDEEFLKQVDAKFGTSPVEPAAPGSPDSR